jgi:hypothetical protein
VYFHNPISYIANEYDPALPARQFASYRTVWRTSGKGMQ